MSGPPRLQVLAGGAFLSPVKVLRVMEPPHKAQFRILDPRWNNPGPETLVLDGWAESAGELRGSHWSLGLRCGVWADGCCQQPSPISVRGGAPGRSGLERPEGGPHRRPAPELRAPTRIPQCVLACWVRVCRRPQPGWVSVVCRISLHGMINWKAPALCIVAS